MNPVMNSTYLRNRPLFGHQAPKNAHKKHVHHDGHVHGPGCNHDHHDHGPAPKQGNVVVRFFKNVVDWFKTLFLGFLEDMKALVSSASGKNSAVSSSHQHDHAHEHGHKH